MDNKSTSYAVKKEGREREKLHQRLEELEALKFQRLEGGKEVL